MKKSMPPSQVYCLIALIIIVLILGTCDRLKAEEVPMTPKVKQEKAVVEYIIDVIGDYIDKQDWVNYDPKKHGSKAEEIADIIEKYEYTDDNYGVSVKSHINIITRETVHWLVSVIIVFKSDERFHIQEDWTIFILDLDEEKKKGI